MHMDEDREYKDQMKERFNALPKVVQEAITSASVEKHLRDLATMHKLHLDQWEALESQVIRTLLGIESSEELEKNIKNEVGVPEETAHALAEDIAQNVFEPIRVELEKELAARAPAQSSAMDEVEAAAADTAAPAQQTAPASPVPAVPAAPATPPASVLPATPPAPAPEGQALRAPLSESYHAGEPSSARRDIDNDPYREPLT